MKTLIFKKNGSLTLENKISKEEVEVDTIKYYLDCLFSIL